MTLGKGRSSGQIPMRTPHDMIERATIEVLDSEIAAPIRETAHRATSPRREKKLGESLWRQ